MNTPPPAYYAVHITLAAPEGGYGLAETLWEVFSDGRPVAAMPSGIRPHELAVTIDFDRVSVHPHGHTTVDDGTPGTEAIAALEGFHRDEDAAIPIMRAVLAVSTAFSRARISPRREIDIAIEPAPPVALHEFATFEASA
jgi:hypothetical protein